MRNQVHIHRNEIESVNDISNSFPSQLDPGDDRKRPPMERQPRVAGGLVGGREHRRRRLLAQQVQHSSGQRAQNCKCQLPAECGGELFAHLCNSKSNSCYLIYLPFLQRVCREPFDRCKKSYRFQHLQSTMKFSSGRKDKSREECDNLKTESFPINVETLVQIFAFVLFESI